MAAPSMVQRSGDTLIIRSVVSGDQLFLDGNPTSPVSTPPSSPSALENEGNLIIDEEKDLPQCKIKRNYTCTHCKYFTQNPRHFLQHLRDVHKEKVRIYECPNCLYASRHFQKLLRHMKMVHRSCDGVELPDFSRRRITKEGEKKKRNVKSQPAPVEPVQVIEEVPEVYDEPEQTAEPETIEPIHESEDEEERIALTNTSKFKCPLCPYTTKISSQLTKHGEQHINTKFFRCGKCSYVTHIKARYTKHVKYHSMPMIKCELCDFRTPYKWNLDRHMKNHGGWGAFKCGACNFAADIKQSLTVHEMNHHVPPVGQAAGLGTGRRRNKVGASDAMAIEDDIDRREQELLRIELDSPNDEEKNISLLMETSLNNNNDTTVEQNKKLSYQASIKRRTQEDCIDDDSYINGYSLNKKHIYDFNLVNGNVQSRENNEEPEKPKKTSRPIPNLIPIQSAVSRRSSGSSSNPSSVEMSLKDINEICAKSHNSALKDFASIVGAEDAINAKPMALKKNNASFFDRLKEKLLTDAGESGSATCNNCGHVSSSLSEAASHQKTCNTLESRDSDIAVRPGSMFRSTRCQYCRHRCKSSADLLQHLAKCANAEAQNSSNSMGASSESSSNEKADATIDMEAESAAVDDLQGPHPMENVVFVWNTLPPGRENLENRATPIERMQDEESSLDLSVRTMSPMDEGQSESEFCVGVETAPGYGATLKTLPRESNDYIAEKKVFKCPSCPFWATTASRFHVHIVGHLNRKPFECSLCSYRSNWRWDITKHIRLKSVRDKGHEDARVLMTDETGRRNYSKYNAYLTLMRVADGTDGSHATHATSNHKRSKAVDNFTQGNVSPNSEASSFLELPRLTPANARNSSGNKNESGELRPPPPLKHAGNMSDDSRKKHFKCKKCHFRHPNRDMVLQHVKSHYLEAGAKIPGEPEVLDLTSDLSAGQENSSHGSNNGFGSFWSPSSGGSSGSHFIGENNEASVLNAGQLSLVNGGVSVGSSLAPPQVPPAPFRCGHCHQVSNWKHVIQRHCRLKHNGDIRVHTADMNAAEDFSVTMHKIEHRRGDFSCDMCPYNGSSESELDAHVRQHTPTSESVFKCFFCDYYVISRNDLIQHLVLHGVQDPEEYFESRMSREGRGSSSVRFRCNACPYVSNSKAQFTYHSMFHVAKGGEYQCDECSYSVSKRHLLQQHMRVHGRELDADMPLLKKIKIEETENDNVIEEVDPEPQKMLNFCDQCPARFLVERELQIHSRYHGSSSPHKCEFCTYCARQSNHLHSHILVHSTAYQDKTKQLQEIHPTNVLHPPPTTALLMNRSGFGQQVWIAVNRAAEESDFDSAITANRVPNKHFSCERCPARFFKQSALQHHLTLHGSTGPFRCQFCDYSVRDLGNLRKHEQLHCGSTDTVPLSGTDLFAQKTEAERTKSGLMLHSNEQVVPPQSLLADPQFGTQIHGNPDFIYPTYVKNGRTREKRYKCHKCPSAFEKREQYRVHMTLHGAQQRYKCEACDYSVKYYANYVQHMKKHQVSADAQAARRSMLGLSENANSLENGDESKSYRPMSFAEKQAEVLKALKSESKHRCKSCPFVALTATSLEEHSTHHGGDGTNKCNHCDYVCSQEQSLSEHESLHFLVDNSLNPEAYMNPTGLALVYRSEEVGKEGEEHTLFDDSNVEPAPTIEESEKVYIELPKSTRKK